MERQEQLQKLRARILQAEESQYQICLPEVRRDHTCDQAGECGMWRL